MQALRFIQIHSAGYNQLLGLGLPERGIRAANGTGNFDIAATCHPTMRRS